MTPERLASMFEKAVAFDTEGHLFQPGLAFPPMVCASVARWDPNARRPVGDILDRDAARRAFVALLDDESTIITGAHIAYDMGGMAVDAAKRGIDLLPKIFRAYEAGRVFDVLSTENLHLIGLGSLGFDPRTKRKFGERIKLEIVHELTTGKTDAKVNDVWRKSYALLEDVPMAQWPPEAISYPIEDACNTLEDALAQAGLIPNVGIHDFKSGANGNPVCSRCNVALTAGVSPTCVSTFPRMNIHDLSKQVKMAFAMNLSASWGITPDPVAVAKLKFKVTKSYADDVKPFTAAGIVREDGTECQSVLKGLVARAYGSNEKCPACAGTVDKKGRPQPGKVPSEATNGRTFVNCKMCDGTALALATDVPRAEKGGVSKARDTLIESGSELLMNYGGFTEFKKIRETYIPDIEEAIAPECRLPDDQMTEEALAATIARIASHPRPVVPIIPSPNPLLETNRTSYSGLTQTMPREGGVRECFVARPGMVYYSCDYGTIELRTWAQICLWMFGKSDLAKALNTPGMDIHSALAASMVGETYESFKAKVDAGDKQAKKYRQAAKPGNFTFPGGGAELTFTLTCRDENDYTYCERGPLVRNGKRCYKGIRFCILMEGAEACGEKMIREYKRKPCAPVCERCVRCAKRLRDAWAKQWGEAEPYFERIQKVADLGWQKHPISERIRGGVGYCDAANGYFQELAAQGGKDAYWHVTREQYDCEYIPPDLGHTSPLLNKSRNIAYLHDELFGEAMIEVAPEQAERICTVMKNRMELYVPDVLVTVEPTIMPAWYKQAACVRDANGRLQVWRPKEA